MRRSSSSDACQPENTTGPEIVIGSNPVDAAADGLASGGVEGATLAPAGLWLAPPFVHALIANKAAAPTANRFRRIIDSSCGMRGV